MTALAAAWSAELRCEVAAKRLPMAVADSRFRRGTYNEGLKRFGPPRCQRRGGHSCSAHPSCGFRRPKRRFRAATRRWPVPSAHAVNGAPLRRTVPGTRGRRVRPRVLLGRRAQVLEDARRLHDRGRLCRRLDAEPDISGSVLGADRARRGRARRLRSGGRVVRRSAEGVLGEPRPDAGDAAGQRRRHAVSIGDLHVFRGAASRPRCDPERRFRRRCRAPATGRSRRRSARRRSSTTPSRITSSTSRRIRTGTAGLAAPASPARLASSSAPSRIDGSRATSRVAREPSSTACARRSSASSSCQFVYAAPSRPSHAPRSGRLQSPACGSSPCVRSRTSACRACDDASRSRPCSMPSSSIAFSPYMSSSGERNRRGSRNAGRVPEMSRRSSSGARRLFGMALRKLGWRSTTNALVPKSKWLETYARDFDTVELNNSFYRLPTAAQFRRWREAVPAGFSVFGKGQPVPDASQAAARSGGAARSVAGARERARIVRWVRFSISFRRDGCRTTIGCARSSMRCRAK